jgi:hypothetical protein
VSELLQQPKSASGRRRYLHLAIGVAWLLASCGGLVMLAQYANSPGEPLRAPVDWPGGTKLRLSEQGATLVLFAHPRCACTRATLGELAKITTHFPGAVTPWVVFFKPGDSDGSWERTDLWTAAEAIPGVHVVSDVDGVEARQFKATTSGETLLYDDHGKLLFNGGITVSRGHSGDNAGRSAIESVLSGSAPDYRQTPVFGCPIAVSTEQEWKLK